MGAMALIKSVIADSILTAMWVFSIATLGTLTVISTAALGIQAQSTAGLVLTVAIASTLMLIFSVLSAILGGASFNPATTVTFYAAGLRPDSSLLSMAVRFPAQAAAGALGARAISHVMPDTYRHMLRGPSLKVELHKGAAAEGVLTFAISFLALLIFIKGPRFLVVKIWLLAMVTVGLVIAGSRFTGPSMNPANAFGWAYMNNWHNTWEQFYVYWISPLIGAAMAALVFKILFPIKKPKQKEA